jgi:hypothetical protein
MNDQYKRKTFIVLDLIISMPMPSKKIFKMKGTYHFQGRKNNQSGQFEIWDDGNLTGTIYDPNSSFPNREVEGSMKHSDGKTILDFVKSSKSTPFVDIFYHVEKPGEELHGKYEGSWSYKEKPIVLGTAFIPEKGGDVVVIKQVEEVENKASLTLTLSK